MQNIADHFINKYSSRCNAGIESMLVVSFVRSLLCTKKSVKTKTELF